MIPKFSVIIATYNWSAALKIAIDSVLNQTEQCFEIRVVGDCCTDDSEEVVNSYSDERIFWHNLHQNCGSQWGPNNYGLSIATGKYIAYLGHDDVWHPTHLANALECFEKTGADVVAAGTLMYGPADSGIHAVTGFFPNGIFSPIHFFPPSSMCHHPRLSRRLKGWRSPKHAKIAVDYDFLLRCYEQGAKFAMTGKFSVFKFNAAWRRGSYQSKDVSDQHLCLTSIQRDKNKFLIDTLTQALRSATDDRLVKIETPLHTEVNALSSSRFNQVFKGSHSVHAAKSTLLIHGPVCFARDDKDEVFEWHNIETHPIHGKFRWSGPSRTSVITLPIRINRSMSISILVLAEIKHGLLRESVLRLNETIANTTIETTNDGSFFWRAIVSTIALPENNRDEIRISISTPLTYRPRDLGINEDRRWLGLAIGRIEFGLL